MFVWLGNANGSFQQTPKQFIVSTNGGQPGPVAMADFNRDGMMDFAETYPGDSNLPTEYYINATARTNCGMYTISPTVTVCQPVDNTYSPSPVRVQAKAYDTAPVTERITASLSATAPIFGRYSHTWRPVTLLALGRNGPPVLRPGFMSKVSIWLAPPFIHSRMHRFLFFVTCSAALRA